jgi:hypothetical protein
MSRSQKARESGTEEMKKPTLSIAECVLDPLENFRTSVRGTYANTNNDHQKGNYKIGDIDYTK